MEGNPGGENRQTEEMENISNRTKKGARVCLLSIVGKVNPTARGDFYIIKLERCTLDNLPLGECSWL